MSTAEVLFAAPHLPSTPAEAPVSANDDDLSASIIVEAGRRLRMLKEISEIGMDLLRALQRQVLTAEPHTENATSVADPAGAFAKLSRAVRLTLNFEIRAGETLRALHVGETAAREERRVERKRREDEAEDEKSAMTRDRIYDRVATVIDREAKTDDERWDLFDALKERLDMDCAYEDMEDRPLNETVARLCNDLRLDPDWTRWTGDDWAAEYQLRRPRCSLLNNKSGRPLLKHSPRGPRDFFTPAEPQPPRRE